MTYEEQVRRELEKAAVEQQQCPVEEDVDAAFSMLSGKKKTIGRRPSMLSGNAFKTGRKYAKERAAARKAKRGE